MFIALLFFCFYYHFRFSRKKTSSEMLNLDEEVFLVFARGQVSGKKAVFVNSVTNLSILH